MQTMTIEEEILDLETRFWNTMKDKDTKAALQLTNDPCLVTGAQGVARIDKKAFAKMMDAGKWTLHNYKFDNVEVQRLSDDVAVICYKVTENLTVDGKRLVLEAADASTWTRKNGRWLCALHTESVLGDPFGRDRRPAN